MHPALVVGVLLNTLLAFFVRNPEMPGLDVLLAVLLAPQYVGLILIAAGRRRWGARVVLISTLLLIPIGLVAAFGARQLLEDLDREAFELETAQS